MSNQTDQNWSLNGTWYQQAQVQITAQNLGVQVGDYVTIITPVGTYVDASWGSISVTVNSTEEGKDCTKNVWRVTEINSYAPTMIIGVNARNETGTKSRGGVYVSRLEPESYTDPNIQQPVASLMQEEIKAAPAIVVQKPIINQSYTHSRQFAAYWAGWTGMTHNLASDYASLGLTTLYLAFADFVAERIDTTVSGWLTSIPQETSQLQPSYQNWTQFAFASPQTRIVLSLGGATFSSIWTDMTAEKVESIAQQVNCILQREYPVYSGQFAREEELVGKVQISGIDLDVELGGARLSTETTAGLVMLVNKLREVLPRDKIVTMATFSVAADPPGRETVQGSNHSGEAIDLLQQIGPNLDYVNVMAYDAGQEYASSGYQTAMDNYTQLVGTKAILGLDNQNQWPGFAESEDQLVEKAGWALSNQNVGGIFLWEIGGAGDNLALLRRIASIYNTL